MKNQNSHPEFISGSLAFIDFTDADPPERAADLAVFLASDAAKAITGRLISAVWDPCEQWQRRETSRGSRSN